MPKRFSSPSRSHSRYSIVRKLGSGGAGSVYLARDLLDDGQKVALKVFRPEIAPEEILREFRILRELRHLGIARAYDFGRLPDSGQTFFTMEYVAGPNLEKKTVRLRRQARKGLLTPLLDVFLQVVAALGYLHSKGLLHLDLKPSNVVFSDGRAKLIDFGLFQDAHLKDPSRVRGTAYYIAPEMFAGRSLDCRADLYSLGVTLYRSFTGKYPITGVSLSDIADNHRRAVPPPPGGLPEELSGIIMKLLAKSPGRRFQTAEEVEKALRALYPKSIAPPHKIPFHDPEFVGRKVELDAFFTWIEALDKPSGARTLVVEGEPGIGKSRFVEACITEMVSGSVKVLSVPGYTVKNQNGMEAVLRRWFAIYGLRREHKVRYSFLLTSAGLASHAASLREIKQMDLEQIRARVFQEALQLFGELARTRVVMVIEDLHKADSQLLDFVRRFTESEAKADVAGRLGLVVSCRLSKEAVPPLGLKQACVIRCGPLKREEIKKSLQGLLPLVGARTVSHLARTCRGNPGVLVQLIHQVLSAEGHGLPADFADLRALLRERLRGLKKSERLLILFLGLLDMQPTSGKILQDLTGLSATTFYGARKSLTEAGLLRGDSRGYFLVPDFLGELVVSDYGAKVLREAHEGIGLRLLKNRKTEREAAKHLLLSGRMREGLLAAKKAGKDLREAGRVEEALSLYREAIQHAPRADEQAYFLEELGDLLEKSGQFDQAASAYDRVIHAADLAESARLRALRKLGGIFQRSGRNEEARRVFDEALQLLEKIENPEEHLYLLNELAALHLFRGEFSQSTTFANRGLEILGSRAAEQLSPESRALHDLNLRSVAGHILLRQFEYRRAAEELQRSLKVSERIGTLSNTALILNNLGVTYYQSNRLREALDIYRRAADLARKMGDETALFSIQCNVAGVRSRLGEILAAEEMLDSIEEMPHTHRSKRAHLLLLHSRGLLARLTLADARGIWQEGVRLADELPDPLIASYGRIYLFENEIFQGRWHSARKVLQEIEGIERRDARMERAITIRRAYLEALCGNKEKARSHLSHLALYDSTLKKNGETNDYGNLWDRVLVASALMEIGKLADAEQWLKGAKICFGRLRQHPGTLECSLLRAQVALRRGQPGKAEKRLKEARRALSLHDTSRGSRGAAVRIPFLEARLGMQSSRTNRTLVADRLLDAAGNFPFGARWEIVWLLDLVAKENGEAGSQQKVSSSKAHFVRGLSREDRKSYLARDHGLRLGLGGIEASDPSEEETRMGFLQEHMKGVTSSIPRATEEKTALIVEDGERTRTFVAATFVESESPRMREVLTMIRRTKGSRLPVLLTGESGTGKDLLARWIHSLSPCREHPFVLLDCSVIPEGLFEAELFGHEAGAFTGAEQSAPGCLRSAEGGTVYLDNVDSVSLGSQAKLLRGLEEKEIRPLGSSVPARIDVRFIASTQRDLKDLCARGEFRNDLYFRLSGICLGIPPLREYVEDIPQLLKHFQRQVSCGKLEFTRPALEVLRSHPWPGNVRELESAVRRLALTSEGVVGKSEILHALGVEEAPRAFPRWIFEGRSYSQALQEVKREYLLHLFELHKGDIARIARELQTTKRNVYQRFIQVGLHAGDLRADGRRQS